MMLGRVARRVQRVTSRRAFASTAGNNDSVERTESLYFTTRDYIKGREVLEEFGMVSAVAVRSKSVISDMYVALAGLVGGEAASYTSLMNETMAEAVHRVQFAARAQGATAVINVRFDSNTTMNRLVFGMHCSVICYGTAVKCRPMRDKTPKTPPFATTEK
ncbi:uncharacterized protein KRP23_7695 [Phytophthora ramorum]|uniref:uncharacterized protein n=1 Tax=Phytophthora ramorum TaxID=164328 RepID=UPI0030ABCA14|nr:hypothetical protein KRP23_7695 [Phytophthora ramorum]